MYSIFWFVHVFSLCGWYQSVPTVWKETNAALWCPQPHRFPSRPFPHTTWPVSLLHSLSVHTPLSPLPPPSVSHPLTPSPSLCLPYTTVHAWSGMQNCRSYTVWPGVSAHWGIWTLLKFGVVVVLSDWPPTELSPKWNSLACDRMAPCTCALLSATDITYTPCGVNPISLNGYTNKSLKISLNYMHVCVHVHIHDTCTCVYKYNVPSSVSCTCTCMSFCCVILNFILCDICYWAIQECIHISPIHPFLSSSLSSKTYPPPHFHPLPSPSPSLHPSFSLLHPSLPSFPPSPSLATPHLTFQAPWWLHNQPASEQAPPTWRH